MKENKTGKYENLAGAIYSLLLKYSPVKRTRRIEGSGWFRFPNVKTFEIHINGFIPELQDENVEKRFTPILSFKPHSNKRLNRYLEHNILRLRRLKSDPVKYFALCHILMKNSNVFMAEAVAHVWPNWYKSLPLYFVLNVARKARKIIRNWDDNLEYRRVYIPKPTQDKWRPLGVPSPEWRVVLHMWNNFLHLYLEDYFLPTQHGCLPSRGTLTAWVSFFRRKVWKKRFIYEIDLRKFFDSVHINAVEKILLDLGVPKRVVYYHMNLCLCLPKLPEDRKLDESRVTSQLEDRQALTSGSPVPSLSKMMDSYKEFVQANGQELADLLMKEDGCESPQEWVQLQWALLDSFSPAKVEGHQEGPAQGAATSPLFCMLTLKDFLLQSWQKFRKFVGSMSYVDDAFFYSNEDFTVQGDPSKGIRLHEQKSGWVKRQGRWLKPLKFLGLTFDGKNFAASTRKGSRLVFARSVRSALRQINRRIEELGGNPGGIYSSAGASWSSVFRGKYIGWVQARLYQGDWNPSVVQDFELRFGNGSWGSLRESAFEDVRFTLANSSSYAARSLVNLLRYSRGQKHLRRSEALKFTIGDAGGKVRTRRKVVK